MRTFRLYRHATQPERAVKVGFSWPCMFLGVFWLLFKRMWAVLLVALTVTVASAALETLVWAWAPGAVEAASPVISLLFALAWIQVAMYGNRLYAWTLRARGYRLAGEVTAENPAQALAAGVRAGDAATAGAPEEVPAPEHAVAQAERRWRYGALAALAVSVALLVFLFWNDGASEAIVDESIHPSVAFHMVAEDSAPGAFAAPYREPQDAVTYSGAPGESGRAWLQGEPVVAAGGIRSIRSGFSYDGQPVLDIELTPDGTARMAETTEVNVGGRMALVVRGRVAVEANIQGVIPGGSMQLTTGLTLAEMEELVREMHESENGDGGS